MILRQHPVVMEIVNLDQIGSLLGTAMRMDIVVAPGHPALLTVHSHQLTVAGYQDQQVLILRKRRSPELLGELTFTVAILGQGLLLRLRIIVVKALVIGLHIQVLLRVDIDTVNTAFDTDLAQDRRWVTHRLLRLGIEHAEVHTLSQPQPAVHILPDVIHIVVTERGRVGRIRIVGTETVAVVTVQTIRRGDPHEAFGILEDIVDLRVRQTVARIQAAELHVRNQRVSCIHAKAAHKQQER